MPEVSRSLKIIKGDRVRGLARCGGHGVFQGSKSPERFRCIVRVDGHVQYRMTRHDSVLAEYSDDINFYARKFKSSGLPYD